MSATTPPRPLNGTNTSNADITVFRGWEDPGKYVWSPYVTKLEARLRLADVKYGVAAGSVKAGPKGKIPYVECSVPSTAVTPTGAQKVVLGDSTLIIKSLMEWDIIPDLNSEVNPQDRAEDLALRALLEDKLTFYHVSCCQSMKPVKTSSWLTSPKGWERWIQNYYIMRDHVLWSVPYPVRLLVGLMIHRNMTATLHGQGTGRFSAFEIAAFRREIWEGFSDLLLSSKANSNAEGADPFWVLGGEHPTEADCVLFGFIVSVLVCKA